MEFENQEIDQSNDQMPFILKWSYRVENIVKFIQWDENSQSNVIKKNMNDYYK